MQIITSVSLSKEQKEFCEKLDLSLSKLLQNAISVVEESTKVSEKFMQEQTRKILALNQTMNKQRDFIEAEGMMGKYLGLVQC